MFEPIEGQEIDISYCLKLVVDSSLSDKYRVFGSVLATALLGKPHRKIGDIDLILDSSKLDYFLNKLKKLGFVVYLRIMKFMGIKFEWIEIEKKDKLGFTVFPGDLTDQGFVITLSKNIKLIVPKEAIKSTKYIFDDVSFSGIPSEYAYLGALRSKRNPKRKYDLAIFEAKMRTESSKGLKDIEFWYKNTRVGWIYPFLTFMQNLLGFLALRLGKSYDFWRDMNWGIDEKRL
ncbi:hypothetical protein A2955_04525 [Candidatus Woesebacteria bacterium RIFCSPLOWO2_01_FULL_37_19]|uniref:Uncharacterized protein n=1 Tax=Candidatus Woesebacteria bacterium RIFCSPLOWO2_01_FULL_37_19 TaxID=1802514 RepID=A0A1F8B5F6_9BACT|nr:MAG: hypothetical protein A2955_04525 [Candidatus Woesebacteria bacterium RIFCSPLOWO2_01_FULL_37_19]